MIRTTHLRDRATSYGVLGKRRCTAACMEVRAALGGAPKRTGSREQQSILPFNVSQSFKPQAFNFIPMRETPRRSCSENRKSNC